MLWLALHFHSLSLEVFTRGAAVSEPLAVIERRGNRSRVVTCNYAAQACGVRAGMTAPAAQALADSLVVRRRDPAAEQTSLDGLAVWAGCFTPSVSLVPPDGLLLEISTCLSLHRGLTNLLKQARNGIGEMGYAASMSCAPSSHGAWLLAKAGIEKSVREQARMEPVHAAEALRFAAHRLLPELEGFLMLRQAGVQEMELVCRHERCDPTVVKLGFVKPVRDAGRMQLLLRETQTRTRKPALVHTIVLRAPRVLPLVGANSDLFQEKHSDADGDLLLERLRIRLGPDAVYGLETASDHRPERAWRSTQGPKREATANRHRPLWLLPRPQPCQDGGLKLKSGPERIESGWWDGGDVARDYYVAEDRNGVQLWVYCDRGSGEWYVHGVFA